MKATIESHMLVALLLVCSFAARADEASARKGHLRTVCVLRQGLHEGHVRSRRLV